MENKADENTELINVDKMDEISRNRMQAKEFLKTNNRVVITGEHGAGKTSLAKAIVDGFYKECKNFRSIWIFTSNQLKETRVQKKMDIYIFDGIFHKLQTESSIIETFEALQPFLKHDVKCRLIITMPSSIWEESNTLFSKADLDKVHIDINTPKTPCQESFDIE